MSVALDVCLKGLRPNISMQMNDDYERMLIIVVIKMMMLTNY